MSRDEETERRRDEVKTAKRAHFVSASLRLSVSRRSAFTLTEILIVIGLIVLLLALAVPAFNLISGGRSIEGATNQVSAMLGRARAQAIGLQTTTGVMFFVEPRSQRVNCAIVVDVTQSNPPSNVGPLGANAPDVWLDVAPDADFLALPAGISVQTMCDATFVSNARTTDGYLGFNTAGTGDANTQNNVNTAALPTPGAPYGGVILFDGAGRLVSVRYGFRCYTGTGPTATLTPMGGLLKPTSPVANGDMVPGNPIPVPQLRSQFGFVLFESELFKSQSFTDSDPSMNNNVPTYGTANSANVTDEAHEEAWLDQNATPILINRFTGTLVKGQ